MRELTFVVAAAACGGASSAPVATPPAVSNKMEIVVLDPPPPDSLVLDVRAFRWRCTVKHARDVETDDLRVPVGRPVKLVVWTPEWPQRVTGIAVSLVGTPVNKEVVKDHPVEVGFRIDQPGTYEWKCPTIVPEREPLRPGVNTTREYEQQFDPIKPLTAMPAAEYDAFIVETDPNKQENKLDVGLSVYERKGCNACHTLDGTPRVGPSWKGIWGTQVTLADGTTRTVDETYVRESILTPQVFARPGYPKSMPSFEAQIREREIVGVIALIQSLASQ